MSMTSGTPSAAAPTPVPPTPSAPDEKRVRVSSATPSVSMGPPQALPPQLIGASPASLAGMDPRQVLEWRQQLMAQVLRLSFKDLVGGWVVLKNETWVLRMVRGEKGV